MIKTIIAWDLGATKCTAGIVEYNELTRDIVCKKSFSIKLIEANSLEHLIQQLELGLNIDMSAADAICIAGAGQYNGETLLLENGYPYPMHFASVAAKLRWPAFDIIHDYAPIVCATFTSYMQEEKNIKRLNTCAINPNGRRVALGIGTGLGLKDGVLLPNGDFWLGRNEAGHIGITTAPMTDSFHRRRHEELMRFLTTEVMEKHHQGVTFEKILSGQGLVRLYHFLYSDHSDVTPEQVGDKMKNGETPELLDMFAWYTGLFVGTTQLLFMPEGGTWITGGVALHHLDAFDRPAFFNGIDASPAYLAQRETYPLGILCNLEHALIGCGYYAVNRLINSKSGQLLSIHGHHDRLRESNLN